MGKLIEVVNIIMEEYPQLLLSGSLALNLQGIKTRRAPGDVDFYVNDMFFYPKIDGLVPLRAGDLEDDLYEDDYFERMPYKYGDIKVDFFKPVDNHDEMIRLTPISVQGIQCVLFSDIIGMKVRHAYGKHFSRYKHKDDIVYMMSNIY